MVAILKHFLIYLFCIVLNNKFFEMPRRKIENRTIEVILLQADKHLGERYETVKVKPIFARNVLLPNGIAVLADKGNINKYSQKIIAAHHERQKRASSYEELIQKIVENGGLKFVRKVNKEGTLYAKVSESDLVELIKNDYKIDVDTYLFKMKKKIETVGKYLITFVYQNLKKDIDVIIEAEKEEVKEKKSKKVEEVVEETKEVDKE